MSISTAVQPSARVALDALIDYAGLFPPAGLPMKEALAEYAAACRGPAAWMLGQFIVPVSRIAELLGASDGALEPLGLSAILDVEPDSRRWFGSLQASLEEIARLRAGEPRVRIVALEVPLPAPASAREGFDAVIAQLGAALEHAGLREPAVYAEAPRGPRWLDLLPDTMTALARARIRAKLRCGGATAQAYPSVAEVAAFVRAAAAPGIAFKATAGLHHPVRHTDPDGEFKVHGFLNILGAATFASQLDPATLEDLIAEEDAAAFGFDATGFFWRAHRANLSDVRSTRQSTFTGYGSCSFEEPVEDLTTLGVLPAAP